MNGKENVVCILNEIFIHKNETVICSIMDEQETIMLSEISQAWKDRWHTVSLKRGNENTGFKEAETRAVVPRT